MVGCNNANLAEAKLGMELEDGAGDNPRDGDTNLTPNHSLAGGGTAIQSRATGPSLHSCPELGPPGSGPWDMPGVEAEVEHEACITEHSMHDGTHLKLEI